MHLHTVPADMAVLRNDLYNFCVSAGFTGVAMDTVTLTCGVLTGGDIRSLWPAGSGFFLMPFDVDASGYYANSGKAFTAWRAVVKDPAGSCYIHLLFYSHGTSVPRRGVSGIPVFYVDCYISTGWDGSADASPGICKACTWRNVPESFYGVDFYAGQTSEGRRWVHVALEESPLVYNHMGFGSIEKTVDFTGGDFISPNGHMFIMQRHIQHGAYASFTTGPYNSGTVGYLQPVMYAPDLDAPGKLRPGNLYRTIAGYFYDQQLERPELDIGSTSMRCTYSSATPDAYDGGGGDLSVQTFPLPNPWSGTAPFLPIFVYASNALDMKCKGAAGYFSGVRSVNVKNFNPGDEITLGPDVWATYPVCAKPGVVPSGHDSGYQGYAVLKNG
ncbi:MAG: hypothetical protein LBW85_01155 [Deltaproteobacteria bacterium]|jgi:hypothetical protein|nr:hypothetical protein [Deltaproteobacteria bacterium]